MHTVLYTFEDAKSRDSFMSAIEALSKSELGPEEVIEGMSSLQSTSAKLKASKKDPEVLTAENSLTRVYVANQIIFEGKHVEAVRRFEQEIASHSAKVELKKYNGEAWTTSRIRRQ